MMPKLNPENQNKYPGRVRDVHGDGIRGKGDSSVPQKMAFKVFGSPKKEKKESQSDFREQQTDPGKIHDASFLNAVVKVYCTHIAPDYSLPWQKQRQFTSTGRQVLLA